MTASLALQNLELAASRARGEKYRLDARYQARITEALAPVREAEAKIREQIKAEFDDRYEAVFQAVADAEAAYDAQKMAEQSAATPYPVGTKLFQWKKFGAIASLKKFRLTGKVGTFEIWSKTSVMPENRKHSKPSIGAYVVRTLRKDGTPGPTYTHYNAWDSGTWLPEGETPKEFRI